VAEIDVSDLLLDPDFIDNVSVIRRTAIVNNRGENVLTEASTLNTVASVQPASYKQIQRVPEALRSSDIRAFFIKAEVKADSAGTYTDLITYLGQRWQVITSAPWLNYGGGWNEVICVIEKASQ
jgi:hypothetical protein